VLNIKSNQTQWPIQEAVWGDMPHPRNHEGSIGQSHPRNFQNMFSCGVQQ